MLKTISLLMLIGLTACGGDGGATSSATQDAENANGSSTSDPKIEQKILGTWNLVALYCGTTKVEDGSSRKYMTLSSSQIIQGGPQGCSSALVPVDYYSATYADAGTGTGTILGTVQMTHTQTLSTACPSAYSAVSETSFTYSATFYNSGSVLELTGESCGGGNNYVYTYEQ